MSGLKEFTHRYHCTWILQSTCHNYFPHYLHNNDLQSSSSSKTVPPFWLSSTITNHKHHLTANSRSELSASPVAFKNVSFVSDALWFFKQKPRLVGSWFFVHPTPPFPSLEPNVSASSFHVYSCPAVTRNNFLIRESSQELRIPTADRWHYKLTQVKAPSPFLT